MVMRLAGALALVAALACEWSEAAPIDTLQIPVTERRPALTMHWAPVDGERRPAVVALHGCGGLYKRDGKTLADRYPDYIARLHALGLHVLLPDSFGSRGTSSICSQRYADRGITVAARRADVLEALAWLRQRPEVDADRIALLGWSNGATTALTVMDASHAPPAPPLAAVVLFYPGCGKLQQAEPTAKAVLMQLGGADDWTPAEPCERLAKRWQSAGRDVVVDVYPGAYHGFDADSPVRLRPEVPNGRNPGGVHQGGNPLAAAAAASRLREFLSRRLAAPGSP